MRNPAPKYPAGSNLIDHTDIDGPVDTVIPEFPSATTIILLLTLVIAMTAFSKKLIGKPHLKPRNPQPYPPH